MIFCGYSGTVQPQLAEASNIIKSDFPVFVKLKSTSTTSPSFTSPKSYVSKSNWISGESYDLSNLSFAAATFSSLIFFEGSLLQDIVAVSYTHLTLPTK